MTGIRDVATLTAVAALDIPPEKMALYRAAARKRALRERQALDRRRAQAWESCRVGAARLKAEFGATRVVAFGSLTGSSTFHDRSDLDIAAWGVPLRDYLDALGMLMDVASTFEVDFVRVEEASPSLRARLEAEGVDL